MMLLAPLFAWLLPLALTPVVFHLFFRVRRRPRLFSSLLFFLAADPRLGTRRRLRDRLVLALRCLALLALLLALARPVRHGWGGGGALALVVVIDNSASMQVAGRNGESRLSRALAGAAALLDDPAVRQAGVAATVRDPAAALPEGLATDRAAARAALASIRSTHAAGDPAAALAAALGALRGAMRESGEVHLFTDLQAATWERPAVPFDLPPGVTVVLHDVARDDDQAGAVALERVTLPARRPVAGRPWRAQARLHNRGAQAAELTLNLLAERSGERQRLSVSLAPGEAREVPLPLRAASAGLLPVRIWLEGAAAAPGAEAWLAPELADAERVWLLGERAAHGLLDAALAPTRDSRLTGLDVVALPLSDLAAASRAPALIAATAEQLAHSAVADACRSWVEAGATLLVTPARSLPPRAAPLPAWCGVDWAAPRANAAGWTSVVFQARAAVWDDLRTAAGEVPWRGVLAWQLLPPQPRAPAEALLGLVDGTPLLVSTPLGRGRVYVSGIAWDARWSSLPRRALFLPLVQGIALGARETDGAQPVPAGQRLALPEPTAGAPPPRLRAVAGETGEWPLDPQTRTAPPRAGVYTLSGSGAAEIRLAVMGDSAEAEPRRLRGPSAPLLGALPHRIARHADSASLAAATVAARQGRSLFGPLLLLAALALLGETLATGAWRRAAKTGRSEP